MLCTKDTQLRVSFYCAFHYLFRPSRSYSSQNVFCSLYDCCRRASLLLGMLAHHNRLSACGRSPFSTINACVRSHLMCWCPRCLLACLFNSAWIRVAAHKRFKKKGRVRLTALPSILSFGCLTLTTRKGKACKVSNHLRMSSMCPRE